MTRHMHSCGYVHDCEAADPTPLDDPAVRVLMRRGLGEEEARRYVFGWYPDEDRLGYDEGHECCPDCGDDPDDHTLHRDDCPRRFPAGHPLEYLQLGPPWAPFPAGSR